MICAHLGGMVGNRCLAYIPYIVGNCVPLVPIAWGCIARYQAKLSPWVL